MTSGAAGPRPSTTLMTVRPRAYTHSSTLRAEHRDLLSPIEAQRGEEHDSGDSTAESSGDEFRLGQARRKKARKPRKKVKRDKGVKEEASPKGRKRVGKLEAVKLVPVEVLLEVTCCYTSRRAANIGAMRTDTEREDLLVPRTWRAPLAQQSQQAISRGRHGREVRLALACGTLALQPSRRDERGSD